jgi:hypothetical protein
VHIESGTARIAASAIALIALVGLVLQFSAIIEQTGSVAGTLWVMLRYFTITTNLLAAVVLTGIVLGKSAFGSPALLGGLTMAIAFVGLIYVFFLRGLLELSGGAKLADFLLHYVTPVSVLLFWLVFAPKGALRNSDPFLWVIYPLAYAVYALARGAVENKYAYPFIDVAQIGWQQTAINILLMVLSFLAAGFALVWLDRLMGRRVSP